MENRGIVKLLILLKNYVATPKWHIHEYGLCGSVSSLGLSALEDPINMLEMDSLREWLKHNLPEKKYCSYERHYDYCWPIEEAAPRIEWLNNQIDKLING